MRTINSLPSDYTGKCDVLFNGKNTVVVNRNIIILYALLGPRHPIPGAAELATHLMYSSALSDVSSAHLDRCILIIYEQGVCDREPTVTNGILPMRGKGALHIMQVVYDLEEHIGMFLSTYQLPEALKNMRSS